MGSLKDKAEQAGHKIAQQANEIGHRVGEKMEKAKDWVKDTARQASHPSASPLSESTGPIGSPADIREHMEVYASCGTFVGTVDGVEGDRIKLTRKDSPDGQHHLIPVSWVAKVHDHVHLSKDHEEVQSQWQPA